MTRDEKFIAACRALSAAERAVAAYRAAVRKATAPDNSRVLALIGLAVVRRNRRNARRCMMYHYAKLFA